MLRRLLSIPVGLLAMAGVVAGAAAGAASAGPAGGPATGGSVTYSIPVTPVRVVRAFTPPATRYAPGHLGVDLAVPPGAVVRAAAAGVVRFAGSVAGRGLVVVLHADGVSTEYEPLAISVRTGAAVTHATVLGRVRGAHGPAATCAPGRCLHWGARRGGSYLDPLLLLRPLGPVRLLPYP